MKYHSELMNSGTGCQTSELLGFYLLKSISLFIFDYMTKCNMTRAVVKYSVLSLRVTLAVSRMCTNFSHRAFSAAGPRVWNYLPTHLRQPDLSYSRV